jgi:hypothetical protein
MDYLLTKSDRTVITILAHKIARPNHTMVRSLRRNSLTIGLCPILLANAFHAYLNREAKTLHRVHNFTTEPQLSDSIELYRSSTTRSHRIDEPPTREFRQKARRKVSQVTPSLLPVNESMGRIECEGLIDTS